MTLWMVRRTCQLYMLPWNMGYETDIKVVQMKGKLGARAGAESSFPVRSTCDVPIIV